MLDYDENYLEHYGVKGQRWGVRRTPQQLGHRVSSGKRAIQKWMEQRERKKKIRQAKKEKERAKKSEKTVTPKKETMTREEALEKLRKTRSATVAYKHRSQLTDQELDTIKRRIELDRAVKRLADQEKKTGEDYVKKLMKISSAANDLYSIYTSPLAQAVRVQLGFDISKDVKANKKDQKDNKDKKK